MSEYKDKLLAASHIISKDFFSEHRTKRVEKQASKMFEMFEEQVKNNSERDTMIMMLKILVSEGVITYGAREQAQLEKTERDA